jgi:hypothetical protein
MNFSMLGLSGKVVIFTKCSGVKWGVPFLYRIQPMR